MWRAQNQHEQVSGVWFKYDVWHNFSFGPPVYLEREHPGPLRETNKKFGEEVKYNRCETCMRGEKHVAMRMRNDKEEEENDQSSKKEVREASPY